MPLVPPGSYVYDVNDCYVFKLSVVVFTTGQGQLSIIKQIADLNLTSYQEYIKNEEIFIQRDLQERKGA